MTDVQRIVLALVSEELLGRRAPGGVSLSGADPNAILAEGTAQAVKYMILEALLRHGDDLGLSEAQKERVSREILRPAGVRVKIAYSQEEMIRVMGDHPYVILKGMAAAAYYAHPYQRLQGDVDFLVDKNELGELTALFEADGYENWLQEHDCHVVFKKPSSHLEMHFEVSGIPEGEAGRLTRAFFDGAVFHRHKVDLEDASFYAPDPLYHGAILLLHMQHHMLSEGIGLRHLCDWAAFVDRTQKMPFWEDLIAFLKEIGLFTYARVMTRTCHLYLGSACPPWAQADEETCREVMEDVLTGGNFGRKDSVRSAGGLLISRHGKEGTGVSMPKKAWRTLTHSTALHYPAVKKHPILWGIFLPWRALQLARRVITGDIALRPRSVRAGKERRSVYERLHVFEREDQE